MYEHILIIENLRSTEVYAVKSGRSISYTQPHPNPLPGSSYC